MEEEVFSKFLALTSVNACIFIGYTLLCFYTLWLSRFKMDKAALFTMFIYEISYFIKLFNWVAFFIMASNIE